MLARHARPCGRASTFSFSAPAKTWMAGTGPAMTAERDVTTRSRGTICPSYRFRFALEIIRGRREGRVPTAPMARVQQKHAVEPQVQADHPAFPAQWLYGLYVLFPVTGLSCHRRPQDARCALANLAPASGRQNHTTSPSATLPLVSRAAIAHRLSPTLRSAQTHTTLP